MYKLMFALTALLVTYVGCGGCQDQPKKQEKPEHVGLSHPRLTEHNRRVVIDEKEVDIYFLFPTQFRTLQEFFVREKIHPAEKEYLYREDGRIFLRLDAPRAQECLDLVRPLDAPEAER